MQPTAYIMPLLPPPSFSKTPQNSNLSNINMLELNLEIVWNIMANSKINQIIFISVVSIDVRTKNVAWKRVLKRHYVSVFGWQTVAFAVFPAIM